MNTGYKKASKRKRFNARELHRDNNFFQNNSAAELTYNLTENPRDFDARGGGEQTVATLPSAHARGLEDVQRVVVVERVLAGLVVLVDRDALEAVDGER